MWGLFLWWFYANDIIPANCDLLTEEQKIRKIGNMLSALKKKGVIKLTEKKKWVLVEV